MRQGVSQRHSDTYSHSEDSPKASNSSIGLLGGKLSIILQCDHLEAYTQPLESSHIHLLLKSKVPNRKRCGRGKRDQVLARECYQAVLAAKENHMWMIEKKEEDKVEALETVELVEGEIARTTRIGTTLSPEIRTRLVQFLKENRDVFT